MTANRSTVVGLALALLAITAGCGGGGAAPTSPAEGEAPESVRTAFCDLLETQGGILAGDVAVAFHAAQNGDLDDAVAVSTDIVLPAVTTMAEDLGEIGTWAPAASFVSHAEPLVDEFNDAAEAFVADPTQESFDRVDVAGQTLRDQLFAGEFARVGTDLIGADCG